LTDLKGTHSWDTDPYGTVAPNQNPQGQGTFVYNLRFPGQYYQAETNLNYNYFRDYDPTTGRYIESDPIGLAGGSYSTYAYVGGNPLSLRDPSGEDPLIGTTVGLIAGGIAGGLGAIAQHRTNTDILYGILSGAAIGAVTGALDPSLGVATLAIIGGTAAGLGDLVGQGVAGGGTDSKPIQWGATAGAVVGGAIGGAGAVLYGAWATADLGVSELYATWAGTSLSSIPGVFLPTIGQTLFPTGSTGSCQ
jgi:RHS repeat-associated protein